MATATPRTAMRAARRGADLPASPIRRLIPLAEDAQRRGVRIHHLNIGQPDLDPPPGVVAALRDAARARLAYAPTRGLPVVLDAWRAYYRGHGVDLAADDILVTAGASEALTLALRTVCDAGDEVLVPEPFYAPYKGLAAVAGVRLVPAPLGPGFAPPAVADVAARVTPRTRALLLSNPNNPTGTVYGRDDLAALGALAVERGFFLLADETYREIVFTGPPAPSALALPGLAEHAVVIDSVSKRFNVCGLRIGALATRNREVMEALLRLAELRLAVSVVDQLAVAGALATPRPYVDTVVAEFGRRCEAVATALARLPGVVCHRPAGAFYVVARLPVADAEHFAAWLLSDFALDGETAMLTPMADFYATPGRGRDEVRIACVFDAATLTRAVEVVGAGLAAYVGA
ncbi:MAG TPA: pyridoxal phosphate-dependent aminotransferase [Thermomicrobiales bacterium]|nr:pyridoxal phosphate-dependent aminotransferase [Thermomicrobiales bacterium]